MTGLRFDLISASSAQEYVDHIVRRAPARLSDLAHHMASTGGPIEEMNGSFESLVPMWRWFLAQHELGHPGIPDDARPSMARFLNYSPSVEDRPKYAAEPIAHYLFEIIRTSEVDARWAADNSAPRTADFQRPTVLAPGWVPVPAEAMPFNAVGALVREVPGAAEPARFRDRAELLYRFTDHKVQFPNDGSILVPLLDLPRVAADDPSRVVPSATEEERVDLHPDRNAGGGDGWILADRRADMSEPETARPLDEAVLAEALSKRGWHLDGASVTVEALRDNDTQVVLRDELALLEPFVADGRLRMLGVDMLNISNAELAEIEKDLHALAATVGAHFGAPEDFRNG